MTIIVDASVAAKWLFRETDTDRARALVEEVRAGQLSMLAPELLPLEVASSLWKRVHREGLGLEEAKTHYDRFARLCPTLVRTAALTKAAFHLALEYKHPVYDCLYVALALEASCPLVTADEGLYHAFRPPFAQVRLLRDWS